MSELSKIFDMKQKILSVEDKERERKALQSAIDFVTRRGIQFTTYSKDGEKFLVILNLENQSTILFKVESAIGGIDYEKFHPEEMFQPLVTTTQKEQEIAMKEPNEKLLNTLQSIDGTLQRIEKLLQKETFSDAILNAMYGKKKPNPKDS